MSDLYARILTRVYKASALSYQKAAQKKLASGPYRAWAESEVHRVRSKAATKAGTHLTGKMQKANIPDSTVQNALSMRLAYRSTILTPKYQQEENYKTDRKSVV